MGERLSGGSVAIALLGNTLATGAALVVLITIFGRVSGAHFNPAVTLVVLLPKHITPLHAALYIAVQVIGPRATIIGTVRFRPDFVAVSVGLYIAAAYWFTASTSFLP